MDNPFYKGPPNLCYCDAFFALNRLHFADPVPSFKPAPLRDLSPRSATRGRVLSSLLVLVGLAVVGRAAQAQTPQTTQVAQAAALPEETLALKPTVLLEEQLAPEQNGKVPVFVSGEHMSGRTDLETKIDGNAMFRKAGTVVRADKLEYDQANDQVTANGNVRVNRKGDIFEGSMLELKVDAFEGFFTAPNYQFLRNDAHGEASKVDFVDDSHSVLHNATYTTCKRRPGPDWMPDWILRANSISMDTDADVGVAEGGVLSFKGVPILPVPAISFPLSDKRKSGFLPLNLGFGYGIELGLPYYWNIAPNRDATITPTLMTQRGIDLGGEYRYLEPTYTGIARANYMPGDKLTNSDRWGLSFLHHGVAATGWGAFTIDSNINRVSDDNYWRDFSNINTIADANAIANTSASVGVAAIPRLLPSSISAAWGLGPFSTTARILKWQTLQDPTTPIIPPYDRVPQLTARYALTNVAGGLDWSIDGDFTQFDADRSQTLQPNAQRAVALLQVSRPWLAPWGYVTPKMQLHAAGYQFDGALSDGSQSASSVVPTFSLDSGLVFERETRLFGRNLVQTLEPRAFYVYTPFRDQSKLPNYDTAANDFNFATIFTENAFVGHDKISDNNLLTLGVTTRFLDADTGAQLARFGIAQRLRFDDQRVTLNPTDAPAQSGFSDVMLGASINVQENWALDTTVQYNGKTDQSTRSTFGARYNPGNYQVFNASYSFQRDVSEQLDLSWQWPLNNLWGDRGQNLGSGRGQGEGRYYSVGRLNYSLYDHRPVDTVLGIEYDGGCWLARVVLERAQTSTSTSTQHLVFQLEFVGFTRLGNGNPIQTLTQNISRYQNLRDTGGTNSRFTNYD